jgi:two-component system, LytTR family, sensor kinase
MPLKSRHYQYLLIFLTVFLLLFLGAMRVDPWLSLVMAFLDTLWIILMMFGLERYLERSHSKRIPRLLIMLSTVFILTSCVFVLMFMEDRVMRLILHENYSRMPLIYPLFRNTMLGMGAFLGATGIRSRKIRVQSEKLMQEKQDMELALLKSRMNPHFVYNALNVLYSLSYTGDVKTPEMIMKLADMLRYITDECQADKVPLVQEIKYIENYLDFQRIRFGEIRNLTFIYSPNEIAGEIPPMILQPFVENAFKHGSITNDPDSFVRIRLSVRNNQLCFSIENRTDNKADNQSGSISERDGVGISSVEKRLQLYYPEKHSLEIGEEESVYKVKIEIEL